MASLLESDMADKTERRGKFSQIIASYLSTRHNDGARRSFRHAFASLTRFTP
jgi:hypothetical protein